MKLVTYRFENTQRVGVLTQDETAVLPLDYSDMNTLIETASPPISAPPPPRRSAPASGCPWQRWSCWPPSPAPARTLVPGHELQGPRR